MVVVMVMLMVMLMVMYPRTTQQEQPLQPSMSRRVDADRELSQNG